MKHERLKIKITRFLAKFWSSNYKLFLRSLYLDKKHLEKIFLHAVYKRNFAHSTIVPHSDFAVIILISYLTYIIYTNFSISFFNFYVNNYICYKFFVYTRLYFIIIKFILYFFKSNLVFKYYIKELNYFIFYILNYFPCKIHTKFARTFPQAKYYL